MSLTIIIPTTPDRDDTLQLLLIELHRQIIDGNYAVQILIELDNYEKSIGQKRNEGLQKAKGDYVAHIDSDDTISPEYLHLIFEGIRKGVDCCSLRGVITENGINPLIFEHSIKYTKYETRPNDEEVRYLRYPNHLNAIKSSIAKRFTFPSKNHGEDTDWATQVYNSGAIKTEHYIADIIYYYQWKTKPKRV